MSLGVLLVGMCDVFVYLCFFVLSVEGFVLCITFMFRHSQMSPSSRDAVSIDQVVLCNWVRFDALSSDGGCLFIYESSVTPLPFMACHVLGRRAMSVCVLASDV